MPPFGGSLSKATCFLNRGGKWSERAKDLVVICTTKLFKADLFFLIQSLTVTFEVCVCTRPFLIPATWAPSLTCQCCIWKSGGFCFFFFFLTKMSVQQKGIFNKTMLLQLKMSIKNAKSGTAFSKSVTQECAHWCKLFMSLHKLLLLNWILVNLVNSDLHQRAPLFLCDKVD